SPLADAVLTTPAASPSAAPRAAPARPPCLSLRALLSGRPLTARRPATERPRRASLLVIGDPGMHFYLCSVLGPAGHDVGEAADGREARRAYERRPADLVLCDLFKPEKDGLETIREAPPTLAGDPGRRPERRRLRRPAGRAARGAGPGGSGGHRQAVQLPG